jgi:Tol biopolymer transport system component
MSEPSSRPVAAHGRTVAWMGPCDVPLCSVHLTDVVTGDDRAVLLGTTEVDWVAGKFSPDGRYLAVQAYRTPAPERWEPGVLVVDADAGAARFVEVSQANGGSPMLAWSPDGRWLLMSPVSGGPATDLEAYSPERDETIDLQLPSRSGGYVAVGY